MIVNAACVRCSAKLPRGELVYCRRCRRELSGRSGGPSLLPWMPVAAWLCGMAWLLLGTEWRPW